MRKSILLIILLIGFSVLFAQNNAPEVTNVTFNQRTDGSFIVDVYYDLIDADGDTMLVTMQVSEDSGSSWLFICDSVSGDVGTGIQSGTGKHIIWDFGGEHPQTFDDGFRIVIIANDRGIESGIVTDIDGNIYKTVKIGNQWWMAENLKVTHYQNGDSIPHVTDDIQWRNLTTGAYCNYNNDTTNVAIYGRLYNWDAVNDNRNIAPTGWHVPSDNEWKQLEMQLGMSQSQANATGFRGTDEGGKMKEGGTAHWYSPNTGATNSSGFSALPGGYRSNSGLFYGMGYSAYFLSSTISSDQFWYRYLYYDVSCIARLRFYFDHVFGHSVRCVRD